MLGFDELVPKFEHTPCSLTGLTPVSRTASTLHTSHNCNGTGRGKDDAMARAREHDRDVRDTPRVSKDVESERDDSESERVEREQQRAAAGRTVWREWRVAQPANARAQAR